MQKLIPALMICCAASGAALARESKPDHEVSFNAAIVSDYRYRGISQTRLKPALQGGADYTHNPSGFYAGTWLSTIKWTKDAGGDGSIEWDIYGGRRGQITADISYDVGLLGYYYPSNGLRPNANTAEIYGQVGTGPAYVRYSHAVTNLFGFSDSRNSGYLDIGANLDVGENLQLTLHAGYQMVRHHSASSYADWKIGLTKKLGLFTGAVAVIGTSTDNYVGPAADARNLGKTALLLTLSKVF